MSKATFEAAWKDELVDRFYSTEWGSAQDIIDAIAEHGGTIHWQLPEGAGCTCSDVHTVVEICAANYSPSIDFDKTGPWHTEKCALYVPF
jgi:hypothetical protein